MNVFAKFDEIPSMILQDIKETKRYEHTVGRSDNVKTVYLPQTQFAGGIKIPLASIIVSRTWKLRFTCKRISKYRSGLNIRVLVQAKGAKWLFKNKSINHFEGTFLTNKI